VEGEFLMAVPRLLTAKQVGELLAINPRLVSRVGIPQVKIGWRTRRYAEADVLAWLRQHKQRRKRGKARR
jgi:predicted DNA-binding transcriptional regulator AlpA